MDRTNDLDPKLQQFAERALAEIPLPLQHWRAAPTRARRLPRAAVVVVAVVSIALVASGAAVANGFLSEVFRSGNVSAAGSRPVTLEAARVAGVPLPRSPELEGWTIRQVQLTITETWRSVDLQYVRPGSRGMGIGVWSEGINVTPTADAVDTITVSGTPVQIASSRDQRTARFTQRGATVVIRVFASEVGPDELASLVRSWLKGSE